MDSITEEYGVDQAATGSVQSEPSGGPPPSAARSSAQNAEQPSRQAEPGRIPFRRAPPPGR